MPGGHFGVGSWFGRFSSPSLVLLPSLDLFGLSCFRGCLGLLVFCSRASFPTTRNFVKTRCGESATHRGSAWGAFRGWFLVWALLVAFSCSPSLSWPLWVVVLSGLFGSSRFLLSSFLSDGTPTGRIDDVTLDRSTIDDQGEEAHAGVFKSSSSGMSDELTGTCSSQECS